MATCFTCGSYVSEPSFTCATCESLDELRGLRADIASSSKDIQSKIEMGFYSIEKTLSSGLSEIASAIQWGFEEITWELQQQTLVLRSIDHTLTTPSETKANEWRLHAEELLRRGVLDEAEEFFLKALNEYRLDFRIYVGLAHTYIQVNKFAKAKDILEKSLPHAPKKIEFGNSKLSIREIKRLHLETGMEVHAILAAWREQEVKKDKLKDYRSYSYRLIGRIYECEDDYDQAMSTFKTAIDLSPDYADTHYDYARCCAHERKNRDASLNSLYKAIDFKPLYWHLAKEERSFEPFRDEVKKLLSVMKSDVLARAKKSIAEAESTLEKARKAANEAEEASNKAKVKATLYSNSRYNDAKTKFNSAEDLIKVLDYKSLLDAEQLAKESYNLANSAINEATKEKKTYETKYEDDRRRRINNAWADAPLALLGIPLALMYLGGYIGCIGGCVMPFVSSWGNAKFFAIVGLIVGLFIGINRILDKLTE